MPAGELPNFLNYNRGRENRFTNYKKLKLNHPETKNTLQIVLISIIFQFFFVVSFPANNDP